MSFREQHRLKVLAQHGATAAEVTELLPYDEPLLADCCHLNFPHQDEPFVPVWQRYVQECDCAGSVAVLAKYLVQLQFPIQKGISGSAAYNAAVRRGTTDPSRDFNLLEGAEQCTVCVHDTAAGHVPVILARRRSDFVILVQALARRNEPVAIPDSMGSCFIAGYNNWHRIALLRTKFERTADSGEAWQHYFRTKIIPSKHLYQDRFVLLSDGPYSGVSATALGLDPLEWRALSSVIRREHECTHYFTRRVCGSMRENLLDELIADYIGITAALGYFRRDWLLRFLGLEDYPSYRHGGRLQNYVQRASLSEASFRVLCNLVKSAAVSLERFDRLRKRGEFASESKATLIIALAGLALEEIASEEGALLLNNSLDTATTWLARASGKATHA